MCVIVTKPADKQFIKRDLKDCFTTNGHGAGFAFPTKEGVQIEKGFFNFNLLWKALQQVRHKPVLLHFRLATSGNKDTANCHPFKVGRKVAMAHNGVMGQFEFQGEDRSDTAVFVEEILQPVFKKWPTFYRTDTGREWLEYMATDWNKLAFLNAKGEFYRTNQENWHVHKGLKFSNLNWKDRYVGFTHNYVSPYGGKGWGGYPDYNSIKPVEPKEPKEPKKGVLSSGFDYVFGRNDDGVDKELSSPIVDADEPIAIEYVGQLYCVDCANLCFGELDDLMKVGAKAITFEKELGYAADCSVCASGLIYDDTMSID